MEWASHYILAKPTIYADRELSDLVHVPRPYVMSAASPFFPGVNKLGYMGPLPESPKPKNEFRIFIFGGSTVFGVGADKNLAFHLEKELRKNSEKIRVYNFGASSSVTLQDTVRILVDASPFEPDLIIMYGGGNELLSPDDRVGYPHRQIFYENNPFFGEASAKFSVWDILLTKSNLFRSLFSDYLNQSFLRENGHFEELNRDRSMMRRVEVYIQALKRGQTLAESLGSRFLSIYQPLLCFKDSRVGMEKNIPTGFCSEYQEFHAALSKTGITKWRHLDYSRVLDRPEEFFEDAIHVNQRAEKIIAEKMARDLQKTIAF